MKESKAWLPVAAVSGFCVVACNMVTGVDDIQVDDEGTGATTTTVTGSVATTGGTGGMLGTGGTAVTVAGVGGSMQAASSGSATTGAGAGPTTCVYPTGPYGVAMGDIVPPSLSWQGFEPGNNTAITFTAEDLFDCDGSRGIHAVVVDTSQYG